jgi:magnesium chelatase family protein
MEMVSKVFTATLLGLDCKVIEVEVDYRPGLAHFAIVGLADKSVLESKERIVSAIRSSNCTYIPMRVIVNLAPAYVPKSGAQFDLAIAVGYLLSTGQITFKTNETAFLGELALDGSVRGIMGTLSIVAGLKAAGIKQLFVPAANASEAALVGGIRLYPVRQLSDVVNHFRGLPLELFSKAAHLPQVRRETKAPQPDMAHVMGQAHAKRALELAATGGHNLLMNGVPGSGKSMMAKCLPGILPDLSFECGLEVTKIHSTIMLLDEHSPLITTPPFRSPHHSSSRAAIVGGGTKPKPGEITLAHQGILFLDELPEFASSTLEALRQPLEDRYVTISRADYVVSYPANFQLVAAMNPCKCGHYGDRDAECTCSAAQLSSYQKKLSGPLLDRFDMHVQVSKVEHSTLMATRLEEASSAVAARILAARDFATQRGQYVENHELSRESLQECVVLNSRTSEFLRHALKAQNLSARAYTRILRVARTIADLAQCADVSFDHIAEAVSYRQRTL